MQKITVTSDELHDAILEGKREVPQAMVYHSRCSEGIYHDTEDLPPVILPGGDIGDLGIILAASNVYGFKADRHKVWELIQTYQSDQVKIDVKNTSLHIRNLMSNPKAFQLSQEDIDYIQSLVPKNSEGLTSDHINGAVILLKGMYVISSQLAIHSDTGAKRISPFIFHYTLVNQRHRTIARELIKRESVELFPEQDEEYLYEVISDMTDTHLFQSILMTVPTLPIFKVEFDSDSNFVIEDLSGTLMPLAEPQ